MCNDVLGVAMLVRVSFRIINNNKIHVDVADRRWMYGVRERC